jgi:hypothetical protein
MEQSLRSCKYVKGESPNCSVAQIREGSCYVFGKQLYHTIGPEIDYSHDKVTFYVVEGIHSLNQSVDNPKPTILHLPLNIAFEVFECFKEIEKENERRLQTLMQ